MLYNELPLSRVSPSKLPLPMEGSGLHLNTRFLGPTQVHNPNDISIDSAVFARLTVVTDAQTDHQIDRQTTLLGL